MQIGFGIMALTNKRTDVTTKCRESFLLACRSTRVRNAGQRGRRSVGGEERFVDPPPCPWTRTSQPAISMIKSKVIFLVCFYAQN